ncbi:MAG: neutral/alkaline non-lysosomal ceramidase N-terminal domain-containing protein, partial [Candidatus Alcyoniella australis]|nr:neutral/alkaline non-lysosomal ceramidase N-terminal domain-containing protein [Candidatus Alcyoniella australis]
VQARRNERPALIQTADTRIEGMNRSRLDPAFDVSSSSMEGNLQPDPLRYPVDKRMTVLRLSELDGTPIGAIVHFTSHPTILSFKSPYISADFPGVVCSRIESAMGPDSVTLYLNGTLGDTAPTPDWQDDVADEIADMRAYGNQLADSALGLLDEVQPMTDTGFVAAVSHRKLPDITLAPLWGARMFGRMNHWFVKDNVATLQVMRLGKLVMIAIPGEPTTAAGAILKQTCPENLDCIIVAPANGHFGYLITPEEYEGDTYAADSCFFGRDIISRLAEGVAISMAGAIK